jgi:hypothetical protein
MSTKIAITEEIVLTYGRFGEIVLLEKYVNE